MRKKDKEITEESAIEDVIRKSLVCRLGLVDGDRPYIIPLCFGYRDKTLYFHSASQGKKIDITKSNQNVCFEFDINTEIVNAKEACDWGMKYQSVIGFGKAVIIQDADEKRRALNVIINQYSHGQFQFPEKALNMTTIIKVEIESMTGKQSGGN